jgi:hypothetical protein
MMLDKYGFQKAITERLTAGHGNVNSHHLSHTDGVIRGLLWGLTGEDPGAYPTKDTVGVLAAAGIKHWVEGNMVHWELP